ncbi:monocarboxylate transporter [Scheffersomyces amazonensis]|uniref:monocarboxylate transporter n=1 Tax=Scheffersomyces amazonensis TaxID=1078765 RepID=UPI00315D8EDD
MSNDNKSDLESHKSYSEGTSNSIAAFPIHGNSPTKAGRSSSLRSSSEDGESIYRTKTNQTELSRILSGIRDDITQQFQDNSEANSYNERAYAEPILVNQLDIISRHSTRLPEISKASSRVSQGRKEQEDEREEEEYEEGEDYYEEKKEVNPEDEIIDGEHPIDGWWSILMSLCTMLLIVCCWGVNSAYGVFLDFYLSSNRFPGATQYDFALIGGLVVLLAQAMAPISIIAFRMFGFKRVAFFGAVVQTIAYILASFATKIWHLFLTQGLLVGVSFAFVFLPATLVLPTWVKKKRATSMGIAVSGAGLGGVIFSLSVNAIIEKTGDQQWALRMCAIVTFFLSMLAVLIMRPRRLKNPPTLKETATWNNLKVSARVVFDIKVFNNYALVALAFWFAIALLGYMLLIFSIASYATSVGLKPSQGSALTSILNAAQVVGRPCMGIIGDRFGRANLTSILSLCIAILIFAFWINATTYGTLIGFCVLVGAIVGIGSSMAQPIATDIVEDTPQKLPPVWSGMNIFVSVFCLVAEVIALAMTQKNSSRPFLHSQIFAGCCFLTCMGLMLVVREWLVRDRLKKILATTISNHNILQNQQRKPITYLKTSDLQPQQSAQSDNKNEEEELQILEERIARYNTLLGKTPLSFFIRMFYPIKV